MNGNLVLAIVVAGLGAIARVWVPYLVMLKDNPGMLFDRKFLVPPVISCIIALICLPLSFSSLSVSMFDPMTLSAIGILFAAGWGVTDMTRDGQKIVTRL